MRYSDAGVDIAKGDELVRRLRARLPHIGGFGGLFPLPLGEYREPVLVAGTDSVGTKILLAMKLEKYDTIGIDLVAMSVNDILMCGAKPLFFLDCLSIGKLEFGFAEELLAGIIRGCEEGECLLLGGETAEVPGVFQEGHFDVVGFAVGVVEKDGVLSGENIEPGDLAFAIPSNGVHSNGYSLVRKILDVTGTALEEAVPWGEGTFGDVLLRPTRIYTKAVSVARRGAEIKGLSHITGGGIPGNAGRMIPSGCDLKVNTSAWEVPPVFGWLRKAGSVEPEEMWKTFNMGIGIVGVAAPGEAKKAVQALRESGEPAFLVGEVTEGEGGKVILV